MARVLVVEDNKDLCLLYSLALEAEGHQVAVAHDAAGAMRLIPVTEPDVIVMEIDVRGEHSGAVWVAARRRGGRLIPLIINTGYARNGAGIDIPASDARVLKSADLTPLRTAIRDLSGRGSRTTELSPPTGPQEGRT